MTAGIGEINIKSLKVGDIDLTSGSQATAASFNIYEDILNPYGPAADIQVVDFADAMGKNPQTMNGNYQKDIEIRFGLADGSGGEEASFKMKLLRNKNLNDGESETEATGHNKRYDIRCCSPELLNAQGNYIQKNFNEPTSSMVEHILKNGFKTEKQIEIKDPTKGKIKYNINRQHPLQAYKSLTHMHVSSKNESSLYVAFQRSEGGNQKYVFTTFEQLFQESPVVTLKQSMTLDSSGSGPNDKKNAIIWIKVPDSFFTPTRPLGKTSQTNYNVVTGVQQTNNSEKEPNFKTADGSRKIYNNVTNASQKKDNQPPAITVIDPANDKERTNIAEAKTKRLAFLSHLSQNYASLEIIGNPAIKLGSMVNLDIFKKTDTGGGGETQFNGKALVVAIRHKIKPLGMTPRYTMILTVIKASYKEGGEGNG